MSKSTAPKRAMVLGKEVDVIEIDSEEESRPALSSRFPPSLNGANHNNQESPRQRPPSLPSSAPNQRNPNERYSATYQRTLGLLWPSRPPDSLDAGTYNRRPGPSYSEINPSKSPQDRNSTSHRINDPTNANHSAGMPPTRSNPHNLQRSSPTASSTEVTSSSTRAPTSHTGQSLQQERQNQVNSMTSRPSPQSPDHQYQDHSQNQYQHSYRDNRLDAAMFRPHSSSPQTPSSSGSTPVQDRYRLNTSASTSSSEAPQPSTVRSINSNVPQRRMPFESGHPAWFREAMRSSSEKSSHSSSQITSSIAGQTNTSRSPLYHSQANRVSPQNQHAPPGSEGAQFRPSSETEAPGSSLGTSSLALMGNNLSVGRASGNFFSRPSLHMAMPGDRLTSSYVLNWPRGLQTSLARQNGLDGSQDHTVERSGPSRRSLESSEGRKNEKDQISRPRQVDYSFKIGMKENPSKQTSELGPISIPQSKLWTCVSCKENNIGCDGERPCSTCSEPGLACNYPGRPSEQLRPLKTSVSRTNKIVSSGRGVESHIQAQQPKPDSEKMHNPPRSANEVGKMSIQSENGVKSHKTVMVKLNVGPPPESRAQNDVGGKTSGIAGSKSVSSEESDYNANFPKKNVKLKLTTLSQQRTSGLQKVDGVPLPVTKTSHPNSRSVPPELDAVRAIISDIQSEMRIERHSLTQSLLRQARSDSATTARPTFGDANPFAELINSSLSSPGTRAIKGKESKQFLVSTKDHCNHSNNSKWTPSSVEVQDFCVETKPLPKYRSIGRLGPNILAPNFRTLKYAPWDAENENATQPQKDKFAELNERYKQDNPQLQSQRECKDLVALWRPWADAFIEELSISYLDICWYVTFSDRSCESLGLSDGAFAAWISGIKNPCPTCGFVDQENKNIKALLNELPVPSGRNLSLATLACHVFHEDSKINLWHIASTSPPVKKSLQQRSELGWSLGADVAEALCLVCYRHHCPTHGACVEEESDKPSGSTQVYIDDNEPDCNIRESVTLPSHSDLKGNTHVCGALCGYSDLPLRDLMGRRSDGTIGGVTNFQTELDLSNQFDDDTGCGDGCFWNIENRPAAPQRIADVDSNHFATIPPNQLDALTLMMPNFLSNKRGPCLIAMALKEVSCLDVFYRMVHAINSVPHDSLSRTDSQVSKPKARTRPDLSREEFALTHRLDERPPFIPCSHSGPCQGNLDCTCYANKIVCEWFCGCELSCRRRYRGCNCAGVNRACFNDDRCECWQLNRECDPHLCGTCGAVEILDPLYKYNDQVRKNRCKNTRLQIDLPKRTVKGRSEVQGWGLYAGEDIEPNDYIGEYKGEIVSNQESDRRGAIYHNLGQEYLFLMNRDQQVDASKIGNKMRFMNDSQSKANINVVAKKMLCNGVQRIMLYSKSHIKAGDELLYNYNYPSAVVKNFWERGLGPTNIPGSTSLRRTSSVKQARKDGRFVKTSSAQDMSGGSKLVKSAAQGSQTNPPGLMNGIKKRKRHDDEVSEVSSSLLAAESSGPSEVITLARHAVHSGHEVLEINASDESEYEGEATSAMSSGSEDEEGEEDEGEGGGEGSSSGSEEDEPQPPRTQAHRLRRISASDRRLGGRAQRDAWRTRKRNLERASKLQKKSRRRR